MPIGRRSVGSTEIIRNDAGEMECPLCNAKQYKNGDNFVLKDNGWLCKTCCGIVTDRHVTVRKKCNAIYEDLQFGKFKEVLNGIERFREYLEDEDEDVRTDFIPWADYIEFRAQFRVLGPIIDAKGNSTGCFTPCNIDVFSPEKLKDCRFADSFDMLGDELRSTRKDLIDSAASYQKMLKQYKTGQNENRFDVFICHKTNAWTGEENTPDYKLGKKMYAALKKKGYRVFFAPETKKTDSGLKRMGEFDNSWRKWIYDALLTSRIMIVIATDTDYLKAPNVRNEWVTFRSFEEEGYYGKKRILPVFSGDCASECLEMLYGSSGVEQENYFDTFMLPDKKHLKLNVKEFLLKMEEELSELKQLNQGVNLFRDKENELLEAAKCEETAGDRQKAIQGYEYLWERYRNPEASVRLGIIWSDSDQSEGYKWFEGTDTNVGRAHAAFCLYYGRGCDEDKERAYELLDGNDEYVAVYYRALCFADALCLQAENTESNSVWKNASEAKKAINALGRISRDFYPAKKLYGLCLYQGIGVTENKQLARRVLQETKEYEELYSQLFE